MMVILEYLYSSRQREEEIAALKAGAYHAEYTKLSEWQLKKIKENKKIKKVSFILNQKKINSVQILLKSDINCKNELKGIESQIGLQENQIRWNITYLDATEVIAETIIQIGCIILGLIFFAAIVVYNIFNIYMIQDIKLFGMMRAVGFEKGKLKHFLQIEGLISGVTGSVIGVFTGLSVSGFLVPIFGDMQNNGGSLKTEFTFIIGVFSFVMGILIVFIGIQRPLKAASKISVIEAIGGHVETGAIIKKTTLNQKNQIRIWDLSKINLSRGWKKNRFVLLSLAMTGVLFIIAVSIIKSMNIESMLSSTIRGDYSLQLREMDARNKESAVSMGTEIIEQISRQEGVSSVDTIMYDRLMWDALDAKKYAHITDEFQELGIGYEDINSLIYGYGDSLMNECLRQLNEKNINLEDMIENNYAIAIQNDNSDLKVNDLIHMKNENVEGGIVKFEIVGILRNNITYRGYSGAGNDFLIHQSRFEAMSLDGRIQRAAISVEQNAKKNVKDYLKNLLKSNEHLELESYDELMNEYRAQKKALETSSYSLLLMLFLISIFNLLNTNLSNIFSRKMELGMLEAVGLTRWQENIMLQTEGIILTSLSCIISILLGIPLGYIGFYIFSQSASYAIYKPPVIEIFVLIFSFLIVQVAVTKIAQYQLNKRSIIEKIENK